MNKIFTLLFAVGMVSIASAQSKSFEHGRQDKGYAFNNSRTALQKTNREYDYKVGAVKIDRHMNAWEKKRQISFLEQQRNADCNRVQYGFDKRGHDFDDHGLAQKNIHRW